MVPQERETYRAMAKITFLVNSFLARVLFDFSALHSLVNFEFMDKLCLIPSVLAPPLSVFAPLGHSTNLH